MSLFQNVPPITSNTHLFAAGTAASVFIAVGCGQFARDLSNEHYVDAAITGVACAGALFIGSMAAVQSHAYLSPDHTA